MNRSRRPIACLAATALILLSFHVPCDADNLPGPPAGNELSQGLWWLYHLQYEKSHAIFDQYCLRHPNDAAGYFYKSAVDWWQLAQQLDYPLPKIEARLDQDYKDTMRVGQAMLKSATNDHERALACLYCGGAEGLKGRWLVTRKQWIKAYFLGKHGHQWLLRSLRYDPQNYDAYMGLGIYDYFTDTLGGFVGAISGLLVHGDRKRGMRELQEAIDKGEHARVESIFFLIEIYTFEEKTPAKALALAEHLRVEFPDSPAVHLAVITDDYSLGRWADVKRESQAFLEKSEREMPYFTPDGVRPANYCLGVAALYGDGDSEKCFQYMKKILEGPVDTSRWVTFAYLRRGQVYDVRGQRDEAIADYHRVLSRADFWGSHDEANLYLKKPYTQAK